MEVRPRHPNLAHTVKSSLLQQVELHPITGVDQGRSSHSKAVPHEVWRGQMGTNSGDGPATRKAHSAAQWAGTAPAGPAVACRFDAGIWQHSVGSMNDLSQQPHDTLE